MAGLFDKVTRYARSPQGKQLVERGKRMASDPKNKERINKLGTRFRKPR